VCVRFLAAFTQLGNQLQQLLEEMNAAKLISQRFDYAKEVRQTIASLTDFTAYIAFEGVMKAGKSTCVSSLIGKAILPCRTNAMTTVPTVVIHTPGQQEPVLLMTPEFCEELSKMAKHVRQVQESFTNTFDKHTATLLFKEKWEPAVKTVGTEAVHDSLYALHDLVRLHLITPLPGVRALDDVFTSMSTFPIIAIEFLTLSTKTVSFQDAGRLALVDTPGWDQPWLSALLQPMLKIVRRDAHAYCIVMNCRQPGNEAELTLMEQLLSYLGRYRYIVANMLDQTPKSVEEIKKEYASAFAKYQDHLRTEESKTEKKAEGKRAGEKQYRPTSARLELSPDQVFPVSAFSAKVVMMFEEHLMRNPNALPIPSKQPQRAVWQEAYENIFGQAFHEEELEGVTVPAFRKRLKQVLEKSNMETFIHDVIVVSMAAASRISCISSAEKTKRMLKDLLIEQKNEQRLKELAHDKKDLEKTRGSFKELLVKIKELRQGAREITHNYRAKMLKCWDQLVTKFERRANTFVNGSEKDMWQRKYGRSGPLFGTNQIQKGSREALSKDIETKVRDAATVITAFLHDLEQKFARVHYESFALKMKSDLLLYIMPQVEEVKNVLASDQLLIEVPELQMPAPPRLDFTVKNVKKTKSRALKTVDSSPPPLLLS